MLCRVRGFVMDSVGAGEDGEVRIVGARGWVRMMWM